jgi:hypothetical protein
MTLGNESLANPFADLYAELSRDQLLQLAQDYDSLNDAAQTALRSEFVRLDWQVSNFIGGIRLQVEESDAAAGAGYDPLRRPLRRL